MIVEAFLQRAEQAGTAARMRAAGAIGKAFLMTRITPWERAAASRALVKLAADPAIGVRQALAYALADSADAPREVILKLAVDEADVAAIVIMRSPVLDDIDLIDIFARGPLVARALVAARPGLSDVVSATLAETGEEAEITILLENTSAVISSIALRRIAERMRHDEDIRRLLAARDDLDMETRAMLIPGETVTEKAQVDWQICEPENAATPPHDSPSSSLMKRISANRSAAPALLLHAICRNRFGEVARAVASLAGMEESGAAAILERGRFHTMRALFEAAGIGRAMSTLLVAAIESWRALPENERATGTAGHLQEKLAQSGAPADAVAELLALAEVLTQKQDAAAEPSAQAA